MESRKDGWKSVESKSVNIALTRQLNSLIKLSEKHHKIQNLPKKILQNINDFVSVVAEEFHISDFDFKIKGNTSNVTDDIFPTERYSAVVQYPGKKKTLTPSPKRPFIFPGEFVGEKKPVDECLAQQKKPLVEKWLQSTINKFSNDEPDTQQKEYEASLLPEDSGNWPSVSLNAVAVTTKSKTDLNEQNNRRKKTSSRPYYLRNVISDAGNKSNVEGNCRMRDEKENQSSKYDILNVNTAKNRCGDPKSKAWKQKFKKIKKEFSNPSVVISKLNVSIASHDKISKGEMVTSKKKPNSPTQYSIQEITESQNLIPSDPLEKDRLACEAVLQQDSLVEDNHFSGKVLSSQSHRLTKRVPFYYKGKCAQPKRDKDIFKTVTINLNMADGHLVKIVSPQINLLEKCSCKEKLTKQLKDISVQTDFTKIHPIQGENLKSQDIFLEEEQYMETEPTLVVKKSTKSQENFKSKPTSSNNTASKKTESLQEAQSPHKYSTPSKDKSPQANDSKLPIHRTADSAAPQESENLFTATENDILTPQLVSAGQRQSRRFRSSLPRTPPLAKAKRPNVESSDDNSVGESPQKPKPKIQRFSRRNSISENMIEVADVPLDHHQTRPKSRRSSIYITPSKDQYAVTQATNASAIGVHTPVELEKFSEDIRHKSTPICNTVKKTLKFVSRRPSTEKATPVIVAHTENTNFNFIAESVPFQRPVIITSALRPEQTQEVLKVVEDQNWTYKRLYSKDVTHLVTLVSDENSAPRTLKYLQSVVGKKWILSFEWIRKCIKEGKFVSEEPYEVLDVSGIPGPKLSRLSKNKIFTGMVFHCMPTSIFTPNDIKAILEEAGGEVVDDIDSLSAGDNPYGAIVLADPKNTQQDENFIDLVYKNKILPLDMEWVMHSLGSQVIQSFRLHLLCPEACLPSSYLPLSQTNE